MTANDGVHPLVRRVATLDRAAKASLRQSLAFPPGTWPRAFPIVEVFVATAPPWRRATAYLVAGLMAWSRSDGEGEGDMGAACARLRASTDSASVERRFLALLEADRDALPHHLRQLVALLSSHGIAPNWSRLIGDLNRWDDQERRVQQRWARSYYAAEALADSEELTPGTPSDDEAGSDTTAPATGA
jgi:CRISPR system Cascade subunit CasB